MTSSKKSLISPTSVSKERPKRKRVQFSCTACKERKVKCDRGRPFCQVCISRKTTDKCRYLPMTPKDSRIIFHVREEIGLPDYGASKITKKAPELPASLESVSSNSDSFNDEDRRSTTSTVETSHGTSRHESLDFGLVSEIQLIKEKLRSLEHSIDSKVSQATASSLLPIRTNSREYQLLQLVDRRQHIRRRVENLLYHLKIDAGEKFDIYNGYKPMFYFVSRINGYGPLAWSALVMKDAFSQPVLENILNEKFNTLKVSEIFYNQYVESPALTDNHVERKRMDYADYINSSILPPRKKSIENLTYGDILKILPCKRIIWFLLNRFYRYVYPFAPFTDNKCCRRLMGKFFNTKEEKDFDSEEFVTFIDIENKLDLAYVGAILVIFKLAYKSLIIIDEQAKSLCDSEEEIYLRKHPLSDRMIEIAIYILDNYDFMKRCTFPVYQLALLLKFYQKIDGENIYSQGKTHISSSILFQMASSLGMNRDPSKFAGSFSGSSCGSLGRKIWHTLVSIDNFQYLQEGVPKSIVESFCDTELPHFDPAASNNCDTSIEKITIELIHMRHGIESEMRPIADKICDIDNPPAVQCVLELLEGFQESISDKFGDLKELLRKPDNDSYYARLEKVCKTMIILEAVSFVLTVYLHLDLKFEAMKDFPAAKFFSNKILTISMGFLNLIPEISLSSHKFFGTGFDFVIIPSLDVIMCKHMVYITSNYVKYSIFKQKLLTKDPMDMIRLALIDQILHTFLYDIFYEKHLKVLKVLASNFFFAWRIMKVQLYIFTLLKDGLLSYENQRNAFNYVEFCNADDLMQTLQLLNQSNYNKPEDHSFSCIIRKYKEDICDEDPRNKELFSALNLELKRRQDELNKDITSTVGMVKSGSNPTTCYGFCKNSENSPDNPFGSIFSVEDDNFWMDIFQNNRLNDPQNGIFRILDSLDPSQKSDFQTDLMFSDVGTSETPISAQIADSAIPSANVGKDELKNKFVDEAIFDLLF